MLEDNVAQFTEEVISVGVIGNTDVVVARTDDEYSLVVLESGEDLDEYSTEEIYDYTNWYEEQDLRLFLENLEADNSDWGNAEERAIFAENTLAVLDARRELL